MGVCVCVCVCVCLDLFHSALVCYRCYKTNLVGVHPVHLCRFGCFSCHGRTWYMVCGGVCVYACVYVCNQEYINQSVQLCI